jgi:hypothetical protein
MLVLFVGSNPGTKSPDNRAFHPESRSRKTLDLWVKDLDVECAYVNVCDFKTPNNRPLRSIEVRDAVDSLVRKIHAHPSAKVIAVGATAKLALQIAGIKDYHSVPHPSGRTRQLNDPEFVRQTVNALISFIKGYNNDAGDAMNCKTSR